MNVHWTLRCDVSSVGDARGALRNLLQEAGSSHDESDAAAMVITELLANAVVHSERRGDLIDVVIQSTEQQIHIEVTDHNARPLEQKEITPDAPSGRGLTIVDALSSAWGWDRSGGSGNRVWCDVPRAPVCPDRPGTPPTRGTGPEVGRYR